MATALRNVSDEPLIVADAAGRLVLVHPGETMLFDEALAQQLLAAASHDWRVSAARLDTAGLKVFGASAN